MASQGDGVRKRDITNKVAQHIGITQKDALNVVNLLLEEIKRALLAGEKIEIRGFGTFKRLMASAKKARDIKKHKEVNLPERYRVKFIASKQLKSLVNTR
jgi:integration host factor subunit beta